MVDAEPGLDLHALLFMGLADTGVNALLRHSFGQLLTMLLGNKIEHHVEPRDAARASHEMRIHFVQFATNA